MAEKINFDQIKKLPPDKRVKVLEELENGLQKFIQEKNREIEQSRQEIEESESLLERAREERSVIEQIELPKAKAVRIDELFRREEKEDEEKVLERIADEAPKTLTPSEQVEYVNVLKQKPVEELYDRITGIRKDVNETGVLTQYQQNNLELFALALREKERDIDKQQYRPGEKAKHMLTAAEQIVQYLKD